MNFLWSFPLGSFCLYDIEGSCYLIPHLKTMQDELTRTLNICSINALAL
jgi:hypothetical protein